MARSVVNLLFFQPDDDINRRYERNFEQLAGPDSSPVVDRYEQALLRQRKRESFCLPVSNAEISPELLTKAPARERLDSDSAIQALPRSRGPKGATYFARESKRNQKRWHYRAGNRKSG